MRTTCWLQVEPSFSGARLTGVSVKRVTQTRPRDPMPGTLLLRLGVTVPDSAFGPLVAEVEFTDENVHLTPAVTVEGEPIDEVEE